MFSFYYTHFQKLLSIFNTIFSATPQLNQTCKNSKYNCNITQDDKFSFNNLICSKVFLSKMCRCNRMNFGG